jgi:NUDIX domain
MQKLSDVNKVEPIKKVKNMYNGYLKVDSIDGYEYVVESDIAVVIPYLSDTDEVVLRIETVPPFTQVDGFERHVVCVSGTIEDGEKPEYTVLRELLEECGMRLPENKSLIPLGSFYLNKGNTAKCYMYLCKTSNYEVIWSTPKGDGSATESASTYVRLSTEILNRIEPADVITAFLIQSFNMLNDTGRL